LRTKYQIWKNEIIHPQNPKIPDLLCDRYCTCEQHCYWINSFLLHIQTLANRKYNNNCLSVWPPLENQLQLSVWV